MAVPTLPALNAPDLSPIKTALLSVSDKTGLLDLAKKLRTYNVKLLSTGGTYKALKDAGIDVTEVSAHTGFPEIMDGRVKTLHPKIHGGILARRDLPEHRDAMSAHGIEGIDLVIVNLYPFAATVASGADFATCVENIDIGGPAMIRASAKNHAFVTIVTDPKDYAALIQELDAHHGSTTQKLRQHLAATAYAHTGSYDTQIAQWFAAQNNDAWPAQFTATSTLVQSLRYGENPHQRAAFYRDGTNRPGIATAQQLQGKELSYNNLNDTDAAYELVAEFPEPAVAIIKHANPCGVATHADLLTAYQLALRCDPVSAFGGIIALNRPLDARTAEAIVKIFSEVIIAPSIDDHALAILAKKPNVRVLVTGSLPDPAAPRLSLKTVAGGLLVQDHDNGRLTAQDFKIVTKRQPGAQELKDLLFAWRVAKHVKSNAIVYVRDGATVGVGAGQMSRLDSSRIAARKGEDAALHATLEEPLTHNSVVASDAFFPFADGLLAAADAGATAIIQPGGSIRDEEIIAAADDRDLAMVFTGIRHFRH